MSAIFILPAGWGALAVILFFLGILGVIKDSLPGLTWGLLFLLLIIIGIMHFCIRIGSVDKEDADNSKLRAFSQVSYVIRIIIVSVFVIVSTYMFMESWRTADDHSTNPGNWGWDCLSINLWAGIMSAAIVLAGWIWDIVRRKAISNGNVAAIANICVSAAFCVASFLICLFVILGGYGGRINYYFDKYEQEEKYVMTSDGVVNVGAYEGLLTQNLDKKVNAGTEFWLADDYEEDEYLEVYNENTWGYVHSSLLEKK